MNDTITFKECIEWLEKLAKCYNMLDKGKSKKRLKIEIEGIAFMIEELFDTYIYTDYLGKYVTISY